MTEGRERAKYGDDAAKEFAGELPNPFPRTMGPNCAKYVNEVIEAGLLTDMIGRFETAFTTELGVKHCIATPGCTPALAVLASAFGFEPGDEIIVSPITDYGTLQGLISEHYIPVFADTAESTLNISAETVEPCITDRTRAVLCVHKTGLVCDMDPIVELARNRGLVVYEDSCQAVFSQYKGRVAGSLGDAAAFSFDSEKTMGSDVGGCIVTDSDELAERARFIGHSRGAVMDPPFGRLHTDLGYAYRMPHLTAAICLGQLEIIRPQVERRDLMIRRITQLLSQIPGIIPLPIPDYVDVYSCWMAGFSIDPTMFSCTTDEFAAQCSQGGLSGVGTGRYYLMPAALTFLQEAAQSKIYPFSTPPASRGYTYSGDSCPQADYLL